MNSQAPVRPALHGAPQSGRSAAVVIGALIAVVMMGFAGFEIVGLTAQSRHHVAQLHYGSAIAAVDVQDRGSVRFVAGPPDAGVTVRRTVIESMFSVHPSASVDGTTLTLAGGCSGWQLTGRCSVNYVVSMPPDTAIRAQLRRGDVSVSGVAGPVTISTSSGDVDATDLSGAVSLQTDSGDIMADDVGGRGVRLKTGSGDVTATRVHAARVSAETGSGSVSLAFTTAPAAVLADTGSGDATVAVPRGPRIYAVTADTGSGNRRVDVATNSSSPYTIVLRTGSGDATAKYAP